MNMELVTLIADMILTHGEIIIVKNGKQYDVDAIGITNFTGALCDAHQVDNQFCVYLDDVDPLSITPVDCIDHILINQPTGDELIWSRRKD